MENQSLNKTSKIILLVIAMGIWAIVLQNAGVIPTSQNVKVVNGVDTYVNGTVKVSGSVDIDNTVDINIKEIQGYPAGSRKSYDMNGKEHQALDVYSR